MTRPHDASGARTHRLCGSLPSRPEAVLPQAAGPRNPPPVLCSLTGMDKHPHAHNPSGRTPPALERDGQSGGCPCFAGKTRVRAGDKATVTGRISDLSIALSGGYSRNKFHFSINRNQSPGPGGRMRAGTRRPSPCRVSIGRAREDQDGSTGPANVRRSGREEGEPGTGPHQRACRASLQGGPTIAKKDNAGRRYCTNPAGLF